MRHIWILSEQYHPEQTSTGRLITETAEGLADTFSVKVISGPATDRLQRTDAPSHELRNGVEIFRAGGTVLNKNRLSRRIINLLTQTASIFWRALRLVRRDDVVMVVTNPPSLPFVALLLSWLLHFKLVLLIHDVYPDALVAAGVLRPESPLVRVLEWGNRLIYKRAVRIVTLGRDMTALVQKKSPSANQKIRCIPHWAELGDVQPTDRATNALLTELNLLDKFVVLYAGNIGRTHDVESIVCAAEQLRDSNVHFLIVGSGVKRGWLEDQIQQRQLTNVTLHWSLPSEQINTALNACDVGLITFVPHMGGISVPSRMYNQMATAKPIIGMCDADSELAQTLREESAGWIVPPLDADALASLIQQLSRDPQHVSDTGSRAREAVLRQYTLPHALAKYRAMIEELA
jgi:glycosyltransferase involved in cell wall biosynthesis